MNTRTILTFAFAGLFAAAAIAAPVGVTVNGTALDSAGSDGEGWTYVSPTLRLTNAGPFTLSGMNTSGVVRVVVTMDVTSEVTLSNLTLVANNNNNCVFTLETNTAVALFLTGTNTLTSGNNRAGLEVAGGGRSPSPTRRATRPPR